MSYRYSWKENKVCSNHLWARSTKGNFHLQTGINVVSVCLQCSTNFMVKKKTCLWGKYKNRKHCHWLYFLFRLQLKNDMNGMSSEASWHSFYCQGCVNMDLSWNKAHKHYWSLSAELWALSPQEVLCYPHLFNSASWAEEIRLGRPLKSSCHDNEVLEILPSIEIQHQGSHTAC